MTGPAARIPGDRVRVDRVLANLGYASRSEARTLIVADRVRSNGSPVRDPAAKVDPRSLTLDGQLLEWPDGLLIMLHKPAGYVCSHDAAEGPRIYDLLPARWLRRNPQVISVGRLDKESSGLLLVTDDHALVHRLTAPSHEVAKRYQVTLDRPVDDETKAAFAGGNVVLKGIRAPCRPAVLTPGPCATAEVVLTEGRHRQIRRMFATCGYDVLALHRTHLGPLALADLALGRYRPVRPEELV